VFDEILQAPVGRDPELLDWVADVSAATVAVTCFSLLRFVLAKTTPKATVAPSAVD
jgi:VanZ family protein